MMITAHSGSDGMIDNSKDFIQVMLRSSVEAFEIDCQLAADGTLYLNHDESEEYEQFLTLETVLKWMKESVNKSIKINIDCKNSLIGPLAVACAQRFDLVDRIILSGSLVIEDFSPDFRAQLFYNFENCFNYSQPFNCDSVEKILSDIYLRGIRVIQFNYQFVDPDLVRVVQRYNITISVWTVNDNSAIDYFLEMGVTNVTSRNALAYLEHKERNKSLHGNS